MTTLLDLLYVALFAVALPLWDNFVFWPAFHRQSPTADVTEVEKPTESPSVSGVESSPVQAEQGAAPGRRGM
jgi:cytoskeletal protein RodZ